MLDKRRAEAVFAQEAQFPVVAVRFPFIVGPDDYTHRLDFHVDRMRRGEGIYFPNLAAKIPMIHASDAADFLFWARGETFTGPLNVAAPDTISARELLAKIQLILDIEPQLSPRPEEDNVSPYGLEKNLILNTEQMRRYGFHTRAIDAWIPELIEPPAPPVPANKQPRIH